MYEGWLTLASHLHMPLRACMQTHTHREYKTWLTWLDEQWNRPSRSDNYSMQVAIKLQELLNIVRVYGSKKQPATVNPDDMKLEFVQPKPKTAQKITPEMLAMSKAGWFNAVHYKKKT